MAEQRQGFRFRLPWLSAATSARPATEPQPQPPRSVARPTAEIQAPAQPATSIPVQRAPFRPAGIARTQTRPQSRSLIEPKVASLPSSPPHTTQARATSVPPTPSPRATETPATVSQPTSPSRAPAQTRVAVSPAKPPARATTQSRAGSLAPSPTHVVSQTQPKTKASPEPQSPSPSRAGTQRATTVASSPSRATSQTQPSPQSQSPSPAGTRRATTVASSPSRTTSQTKPTMKTSPHPQSPSSSSSTSEPSSPLRKATQTTSPPDKSQPSRQETPLYPFSLTPYRASVPQRQKSKPTGPLQLSQEPQPNTKDVSDSVSGSQHQTVGETIVKPDKALVQTTQAPGLVTKAIPPFRAAQEPEKHSGEIEEKKVVEDPVKAGKSEETKKVDAHKVMKGERRKFFDDVEQALRKEAKGLIGNIHHTDGNKKKEESAERKKPWETPTSDESELKTLNSKHEKPNRSNCERPSLHKEIKEDALKFTQKLGIGHPKQAVDNKPISVVTLAGDNKGASMQLGTKSAKKDRSMRIHRGYKLKADESPETTSDGEESYRERKSTDPLTTEGQGTTPYVNNNVQSINNSIMFHSSVNERNPGVHLVFSHNLTEPTKSTTQPKRFQTHEDSFRMTPSDRLAYEPTVRRSLRGLFMEPSDSDPDNPEKPRRHGYLHSCGEKSKDEDNGVL